MFVVLWFYHAWLNDDASRTLRHVLNLTEGHGVVWNWGERVQVFTHPAWFLLLAVVHVLSGGLLEPNILKYSSLFVSLALCLAALWLFVREMKGLQKGVVAVLLLALLSSQAFIDYTSSGLENPLSFFLVALICCRFFFDRCNGFFFLLCALLFLNRMDYALLLLPLCLYAWRSCGYRISVLAPAVSLCLLWLVFATWYFGHPLANTFLAKTNVDFSVWDFILQGSFYYFRTLTQDPVTLLVILCVVVSCFHSIVFRRRWSRADAVGGGVVLYGLYLFWIGGDFMQGRFFSVLFVLSLFCGISYWKKADFKRSFSRISYHRIFAVTTLLLIVTASCVSATQRFRESFVWPERRYNKYHGIVNQRKFEGGFHRRGWGWRARLKSFQDSAPRLTQINCCPGVIALRSDGSVYIVDSLSLGSPYLSRIPGRRGRQIGHMPRAIPTDFEAWYLSESIPLHDPKTNAFFLDIRHVVRGDLFSWNRIRKIAKINFHDYDVDYFTKHNLFLKSNYPRFSRFHPFLQQKASFASLPSLSPQIWRENGGVRHASYNITQSISITLGKRKIEKISFPVSDIKKYMWSLYDGQKKVYEDSYKTYRYHSFHTFTLPRVVQADRLEIVVEEGGIYRRIARPVLLELN